MNLGDVSLMIFAAGFGTRMGSLTPDLPKPMIPVAGRPMIDHAVDLARDAGVGSIVANTHYQCEKLEPHLVALDVLALRETPDILDTGGGLRAASEHVTPTTATLCTKKAIVTTPQR